MKNEMGTLINKIGQLAVVIVGFFASAMFLLQQAAYGGASTVRIAATFLIALGLAVRYWWVILLLEWPFRIARTALLLLVWSLMPLSALVLPNDQAWITTLAALCATGSVTEFYNLATQQWKVNSQPLTRLLRQDHLVGGILALAAAVVLWCLGAGLPQQLTGWVMVLAFGDWIRLIQMIASHRRLLHD